MPGDAYYTAHTGHFEWYTPKDLLEKCRFALGGAINLDPFSHVNANESVCADVFLTAEDDALLCDWPVVETMFANPPYALGLIGKCCRRIEQEWRAGTFQRGIVMVNNATETIWFQQMLGISSMLCLPSRRINFLNEHRQLTIQRNSRGQAIFGLGIDEERFVEGFRDVGAILKTR